MKYLSIKEVAKVWNTSERSVRNYCSHNRVPGAILKGKTWFIPDNVLKPMRSNGVAQTNFLLNKLIEEKRSKYKNGIYHLTQIDLAFNSNRIEGSQLTHDETRYIFDTNTIGIINKTNKIDDIIETLNHFKCFDFMLENSNKKLDEKIIKKFHKILKANTSDEKKSWCRIGQYKTEPNMVGDTATTQPEKVQEEMNQLLVLYNNIQKPTILDILDFHVKFEKIHPFYDGNGRVGRLIMFKECLKNNITPFIIYDEIKAFYYRGIKEWSKQKGFLMDTCLSCQDKYVKILKQLRIDQ